MTEADIVQRLDKLIGLFELAHREEIERARSSIRADKVNAALLDGARRETPAGRLIKAAQRKTGQSPTTVKRRIADLVEKGALAKSGGGPTTAYRATGLI